MQIFCKINHKIILCISIIQIKELINSEKIINNNEFLILNFLLKIIIKINSFFSL